MFHHAIPSANELTINLISTADNTSLNNNNNNNSMNNNTIKYSDKSTQTVECDECELPPEKSTKDELIAVETQTDFTNLHSESICCLSNIPYADMTNSPPPPPPVPYRRINRKITENCNDTPHEGNHTELNQLSARSLQYSIDNGIGATTQAAIVAVAPSHDKGNGNIQNKINDNGENL